MNGHLEARAVSLDGMDILTFRGGLHPLDRWVLQFDRATGSLLRTSEFLFSPMGDTATVRQTDGVITLVDQTINVSGYYQSSLSLNDCNQGKTNSCFSCCMEEQFAIPSALIFWLMGICGIACFATAGFACYLCLTAATAAYGFEIGFCLGWCGWEIP